MVENVYTKKCFKCDEEFIGYDNWWYGLCPACQAKWLVEKNDYFFIEKQPLEVGRKTHKYVIFNCQSGDVLGEISWYGAFRKFCFIPESSIDIVWDEKCLQQLTNFLVNLNKNYREERKKNV